MANFTEDSVRVETVVRALKADIKLIIWDNRLNKHLFNGYVYQLYDNVEFNNLYVSDMNISFDMVGISILTEGRAYEKYLLS